MSSWLLVHAVFLVQNQDISSWDHQLPTKLLMLNASRNIPRRTKAYFRDVTLTKKHWCTTKQNLVKWPLCYNTAFCLKHFISQSVKKKPSLYFRNIPSSNLEYKKAAIKKIGVNVVFLFILSFKILHVN